jgi:hypothetical protein
MMNPSSSPSFTVDAVDFQTGKLHPAVVEIFRGHILQRGSG